ncbi:MAG: hypothetical protein LAO06_14775 [Acidobacteriia bacterium]|nr:hypothetical protein [Terriglobia bacterium]
MRAFTRISITLLLTTLLAAALLAQTATPPADNGPAPHRMGAMSQRGFERMAQQLNLTDPQKTQIQGLFQAQRTQAQSIWQDSSLTPQQRQDKFRQLRESTHQQVTAVLTPEQQRQMQQMRAQREGMGGGMGPFARLNLTSDQKSKIQPLIQSQHQQVQAVRLDSSLTPEQRQAKVRDIRQGTKSQIDALLTPEQQQQLKQMWKGRGGKHGPPPAPPSGF